MSPIQYDYDNGNLIVVGDVRSVVSRFMIPRVTLRAVLVRTARTADGVVIWILRQMTFLDVRRLRHKKTQRIMLPGLIKSVRSGGFQ